MLAQSESGPSPGRFLFARQGLFARRQKIDSVARAEAALTESGIPISGKRGEAALFVRDPDGNVVELAAD